MLSIILFCLGVMYTPGPVNLLSINCGMQRRVGAHVPFCLGVGMGLSAWFMAVGYAGGIVARTQAMPVIAALGTAFIVYLGIKLLLAEPSGTENGEASLLSFRDGLLMQALNPKTFLVVLPVATVQFPAASIHGAEIAVWSVALGGLGFGAPMAYALIGSRLARLVRNPVWFKWFNRGMGVMLLVLAVDMAREHVLPALAQTFVN